MFYPKPKRFGYDNCQTTYRCTYIGIPWQLQHQLIYIIFKNVEIFFQIFLIIFLKENREF
jgi:hypothetical protein